MTGNATNNYQVLCNWGQRLKQSVLLLSGNTELMEDYPVEQLSIQMPERIVMPLITIQQNAIAKCKEMNERGQQSPNKAAYEKLIIRSSFGIINAARNSA